MVLPALPFVHMYVRKHIGKHLTITASRAHIGESVRISRHIRIGRMANAKHTKYVSGAFKHWYLKRRV